MCFSDSDDKILALLWMFREFSHASNLLFHAVITYYVSDFSKFYYCADFVDCIISYIKEKWHFLKRKMLSFFVHTIITKVFILLMIK